MYGFLSCDWTRTQPTYGNILLCLAVHEHIYVQQVKWKSQENNTVLIYKYPSQPHRSSGNCSLAALCRSPDSIPGYIMQHLWCAKCYSSPRSTVSPPFLHNYVSQTVGTIHTHFSRCKRLSLLENVQRDSGAHQAVPALCSLGKAVAALN